MGNIMAIEEAVERYGVTAHVPIGKRVRLEQKPLFDVYFVETAHQRVHRHVAEITPLEAGGVLLGLLCCDRYTGQPFVLIQEAISAKGLSSRASFRFMCEDWAYFAHVHETQFPQLLFVGWYHSHPGYGVYLSQHDHFVHRNWFDYPWMVAFVVDPEQGREGMFTWQAREDSFERVPFRVTSDGLAVGRPLTSGTDEPQERDDEC